MQTFEFNIEILFNIIYTDCFLPDMARKNGPTLVGEVFMREAGENPNQANPITCKFRL